MIISDLKINDFFKFIWKNHEYNDDVDEMYGKIIKFDTKLNCYKAKLYELLDGTVFSAMYEVRQDGFIQSKDQQTVELTEIELFDEMQFRLITASMVR